MLPKAHLTSHSRMSGYRWVSTLSWLFRLFRLFLYISSVYSCHLFLIFLLLLGPFHFCPLYLLILAWNVPLISPVFLKRSLVFSHSIVFLCCLLISSCCHLEFCFSLLLFPQLFCNASSDNHFVLLHFFFSGMVLVTDSCTVLQTSILQALCLLYLIPWIYLSPPL